MSWFCHATDDLKKITGDSCIITKDVKGDNLFVEAKGELQIRARVDVFYRTTIIGHIDKDLSLLHSRDVEIFQDVDEMLTKIGKYASGSIPKKSMQDAFEILIQYLYSSMEDLEKPAILLTDYFMKGLIATRFADKVLYAVDRALRQNPTNKLLLDSLEKVYCRIESEMNKNGFDAHSLRTNIKSMNSLNNFDTSFWTNNDHSSQIAKEYSIAVVTILEKAFYSKKSFIDTIHELEAVLEKNPNAHNAISGLKDLYPMLGIKNFGLKQFPEAVLYFEKALTLDPNNDNFRTWTALTLNDFSAKYLIEKQMDKCDECIAYLRRAIQLCPTLVTAYHNLAEFIWLKDIHNPNLEEVIELFEKALSLKPLPLTISELLQTYKLQARFYMENKVPGKTDLDAADLLEKALTLSPEDNNIKGGISNTCLMTAFKCMNGEIPGKSISDGEIYLNKAILLKEYIGDDEKKGLAIVCNQYAVAYFKGKVDGRSSLEAMVLLGIAIELDPSFNQAKENLDQITEIVSSAFVKAFEGSGAQEISIANKLRRQTQILFDDIGVRYLEKESLDVNLYKSIEALEDSLRSDDSDSKSKEALIQLYSLLSAVYMNCEIEGKSAYDAMVLMERAYLLFPDDLGIKSRLALNCTMSAFLCLEDGIPGKSISDGAKYLDRAIQFRSFLENPYIKNLSRTCNGYAIVYDENKIEGKTTKDAITLLQLAIVLNPNFAMAYYNLGAIFLSQNKDIENLERVLRLFEKALSLKPDNTMFRDELGAVNYMLAVLYSHTEEYTSFDVLMKLEDAYELSPDDKIKRNLACTYLTIVREFLEGRYPDEPVAQGLVFLEKCLKLDDCLNDDEQEFLGVMCNNYALACINGDIKMSTDETAIFLLKSAILNCPTLIEAHENLLKLYKNVLNDHPIIADIFPMYYELLTELQDPLDNPAEELMKMFIPPEEAKEN